MSSTTLPFSSTYGVEVITARPFNHTGPRQRNDFVCSSFAEQVALIENGADPVIHVGDLTPRRDFSDVRDIVRGSFRGIARNQQTASD